MFFSRSRGLRKNEAAIDIPTTLDMRPFVHPEAKDVTLDGCDSYKLFGISEHFGSLSGGHYTSKAQDIDSEEWFSQNDS
jgi:ubiquitin C-terminal hydrolase